jgi:hypothetical protein
LYRRAVVQFPATVGSQVARPTKHTYDFVIHLQELRSVQVVPNTLLNNATMYKVQLTMRHHPWGGWSTFAENSGNPVLIRSAGLPVQTPEDGQRIANALTHAAALCGAEPGSGVF